jgi:hypothetical protein
MMNCVYILLRFYNCVVYLITFLYIYIYIYIYIFGVGSTNPGSTTRVYNSVLSFKLIGNLVSALTVLQWSMTNKHKLTQTTT